MFMLKSLFGKIWGDANNQELIQIPAGSLYLVRPNGPQGSRECIYEDAVLAIRRTTAEYHYQLVVTKAFQDSQPELADDDDLEDERAYLIDQALDFRLSTRGKERTIVWRDLDGDEQDLLEFVIDNKQVNEVTITIFEITFLQCVYEHAFRTSHERATEEDLDQLRYKDEADQQLKRENKKQLDRKLEDAGIGSAASTSSSTATTTAAKSEQDVKPAPAIPATIAPVADTAGPQIDENSTVFSAHADLYLYDLKSQYFLVQERKVDVRVLEAGRFLFWLSIKGADKVWLAQKVESDMNMNFSPEQTSAVWNYFTDDRQCFSWLLRFEDQDAYSHFQKGFSQVMYETQNEEPWAKAKSDDRAYAETAFEAGEPMDVDDISESEDGNESVRTAREEEEEDDDEEEVAAALQSGRARSEESSWPQESTSLLAGQQDVNSLLAVGYKFDRSFVARGDKIGVFRHTDDNKLEHDTTINNVGTPSGKGFRPLKMMLHNQDAQMVLMDPSNKNAIFNMDLEYGKIVDEWKVHDDVQINNVVANNKYAQMTAEKTMIGHSHNGIYRIDPRLSGNKLVDSEFKQYASKNDFSVAATDSKGRLAVASNKGDIRLFDSIGKNAKTALPALGDPILGIDVSADGRYIIATCKTYLLLIDTLIGSGRYQGQLGFDRSFPADAKPQPKRLTLKPSHVAFMGSAISFSPARFNTGSDQETSIVTSTGAYVVSWSFKDVKKGNLGSYVLKRYGGEVISDEHAYGSDQAIVVAFEHDVQMAKRSQLLKPTRWATQRIERFMKRMLEVENAADERMSERGMFGEAGVKRRRLVEEEDGDEGEGEGKSRQLRRQEEQGSEDGILLEF